MILKKRNSLENFIKEQMEGPGACNNQFFVKGNQNENEEVINTTPGSLYSTAVLFPQRAKDGVVENSVISPEVMTTSVEDLKFDSEYQELLENNTNEELEERANRLGSDDEDMYSLSQRFPTTIGLSCCLDKQGAPISSDDFRIYISGRYYTKISKAECTSIVIRVSEQQEFGSFFNLYSKQLSPYFSIVEGGVSLSHDITRELSNVKQSILSINKDLCAKIARNADGSLDVEYQQIGDAYRFLKSYKERLWRKLRTVKNNNYLTIEQKLQIEDRLRKVELYETFLSYLEDALNICNTKSFGFWQSHSFCESVDLSSFDFNQSGDKIIFSPKKNEVLNVMLKDAVGVDSVTLKLSVWLQLTRSVNNQSSKKYIKVQVENTSTKFKEDNKNYFSIVTEKVNERCIFGIKLKVDSPYLVPYQERKVNTLQEDIERLNFLYRSIKDYAVGHMCSVDWKISDEEKWVCSNFIPSYEIPDVETVPRDKYLFSEADGRLVPQPILTQTKILEFKWLSVFSDATDKEILDELRVFISAYREWIRKQKDVLDVDGGDNRIGYENLSQCESDCNRMESNVEMILGRDSMNMESFRLMNAAMFIQLWHSKNSSTNTSFNFYKEANDYLFGNFHAAWRPFQLAFILLNLDGLIQRPDDEKWSRRNELVDLVWFPTGGGKTEAYLGIIALSIIVRRRGNITRGGGTTAIMRYTLRLLATQQFQRAMRVIFALELMRRWNMYGLGDVEPISIGLFVGDDSLPNKAADSNHKKGLLGECRIWNTFTNNKREVSKIPLDRCPFCGELLEYHNVGGSISNPNIVFVCKNIDCSFGEISHPLPVLLCDDYIYTTPPTLLFGTVDKFAMLGHCVSTTINKESQDSRRIFGKGTVDNLPPSLIIQDELHLLLGPLGSAVSLFECAIDQLCSYEDSRGNIIKPKIISSTATTRNTELQIRALYDRKVSIFPKPGIDYDDSFFSFYQREKVNNEIKFVSKRKYLGIFPTGRTHVITQMRIIATMFVHRAIFEKEYSDRLNDKDVKEAMDYYHSVVDYFNSLKEVGKTDAQFFTEYTKYTRRLFKRVLRYSNKLECLYGYDSSFRKSELTGRLSGSEVVHELDKVGEHWNAESRLPHWDSDRNTWLHGTTPPDLILATNMISVGLDVGRFNTIIMNSMPRNIAEYIQASSRVAREKAGLVVTLHNPYRARDLSHFERFREFHEKLYYYVEPISITPFSKKSVNKYMPLFLATMIRHHYPELANVENAANLDKISVDEIKSYLANYFKERMERTQLLSSPNLKELLTPDLESYIEDFIEESLRLWKELVEGQSTDGYSLRYSGSDFLNTNSRIQRKYKDLFIALDAYQDDETNNMWAVPMSLRTVESEAVINVKEN